MQVRIYQPTKTAMQSGRAKSRQWFIEPEPMSARLREPVMGWVSADDTLTELKGKLVFETMEEAQAFAQRKGWIYATEEPETRHIPPKSYLDRFK